MKRQTKSRYRDRALFVLATILILSPYLVPHARASTTNTLGSSPNGPSSESGAATPEPRLRESNQTGTPFIREIAQAIEQRKNQGLPVPNATFETNVTRDGPNVIMTGSAVLDYDGPAQAGKERWEDLIVDKDPHSAGKGDIVKGNYTQLVIDSFPELWSPQPDGAGFTFGFEPRTYVINETYAISYRPFSQEIGRFLFLAVPPALAVPSPQVMETHSTSTISKKVLMGFTFNPVSIDWSIHKRVRVCFFHCFTIFEARAGFALEILFGLRLPATVDLTAPDTLNAEQSFSLNTSLTPRDFSEQDYKDVFDAQHQDQVLGGREFVADYLFFLGVFVKIAGVSVISWGFDEEYNLLDNCKKITGKDCENFVTPFGLDENGAPREAPLGGFTLDPDQTGLKFCWTGACLGIGLGIVPTFGSDKITADYSGTGDSSGNGFITYASASPTEYESGPITGAEHDSTTDFAHANLSNFKFFFTRLGVELFANIQLGGWLSFVPGTPYVEILDFDISDLPELALGQHPGTQGVTADVFVVNYGINIQANPSTVSVVPGSFGNSMLTITNAGSVPDTLDSFDATGLAPNWEVTPPISSIGSLALGPHESQSFTVSIKPFRSYSTLPGDYTLSISGRSEGAPTLGLTREDTENLTVRVLPFHELRLEVNPIATQVRPGQTAIYSLQVQNFGNVDDSGSLALNFLDFGTAFRASPTSIQPSWTSLDASLLGPLTPGGLRLANLMITVPADWTGVETATYKFTVNATSTGDSTVTNGTTVSLIVAPTKEVVARFVDLELQSLIHDVATSSLHQDNSLLAKLDKAQEFKERALALILLGDEVGANNALKTAGGKLHAFLDEVRAQRGKGIPLPLADDLILKATTIIRDLDAAIAAPI